MGYGDGSSVFLGAGDLEIHTMDCCADSTITLPLGGYEGITVLFDMEVLEDHVPELLKDAGLNGRALLKKLCPGQTPLSLPASPEISGIFSCLFLKFPKSCCLPTGSNAGAFTTWSSLNRPM